MTRSILTPGQKRLYRVVLVLGAFLFANTAYLLVTRGLGEIPALANPPGTLPKFYQSMVLSHTIVGISLLLPTIGFVAWHLGNAWKRRHASAIWTGLLLVGFLGTLAVSGLYILTEANSRENRGWFYAHLACAGLVPAFLLAHRFVASSKPTPRAKKWALAAPAGLFAGIVALHLGARPAATEATPTASAPRTASAAGVPVVPGVPDEPAPEGLPHDPFVPFVAAADVPAESVFFPAAATTTTMGLLPAAVLTNRDVGEPEGIRRDLDEKGFVWRERIGAATCVRCHPDVVEQWSRSAHRFSSFNNPFYRKSVELLRAEDDGVLRSKWCSSCHDPVVMLPGDMARADMDPESAHAQAGLTCLSCHQIDRLHGLTGNGGYNIADTQPSPYVFADAKGGPRRLLHDMIVKARPTVHKEQMLKPFFRTSEFCSTCHKVSLDVAVNRYRWLRGQNEYDAWHDSGVALNASRTFYLPPAKRVCQDCHMPLEEATRGDVSAKGGNVRSHRFLAVNTALPAIRGDADTIARTEAFLRDQKLRVEIFAMKEAETGAGSGREGAAFALLDRTRPPLEAGESLEVHVVVRNLGVGHTFPGGTNDSNEAWVELRAIDDAGKAVSRSATLGEDGRLASEAHVYQAVFVDGDSNRIFRRDPQNFRALVFVRTIGPGTADVVRYRLDVPADLAGRALTLEARLLWRKFERRFTEFVFEGKEVPDLPVTTIAEHRVTLPVVAPGSGGSREAARLERAHEAAEPADWVRFNDHGIGLLLQGDTKGALDSFRAVEAAAPERIDGPRNQARVWLAEGNLERAIERLRRCEEIAPADPQTAWFWADALSREGRYVEAAQAYGRVLEKFPEDRAAWMGLGRVLYLDGRYGESLRALLRVLEIEPEHREAHYHRMLCYRALGREREAGEAEKAYRKYQIDEDASQRTNLFRRVDPGVNFESLPIHVHG